MPQIIANNTTTKPKYTPNDPIKQWQMTYDSRHPDSSSKLKNRKINDQKQQDTIELSLNTLLVSLKIPIRREADATTDLTWLSKVSLE